MNKLNTFIEVESRYGKIINGVWANEGLCMGVMTVDPDVAKGWINTATKCPTSHIYVNKDIIKPLYDALYDIKKNGLLDQLKTFDGCFSIRDIRGEKGKPSCHSYGLAIDINAATNKLGETGDISPELVKCFLDNGWDWGGNFKRKDPMHFSRAWEGKYE